MKLYSGGSKRYWLVAWVLSVLAMIAACGTISPRRIVFNNPSPSPTPTVSPTPIISPTPTPIPSPTITPTPTPTPTPTGMAAVVPSQFLFTADPSAGVILGFKINRDGGLSPVPGSPFVTDGAPRLLSNLDGTLLVAGRSSLMAFTVNRETGAIIKTDSLRLAAVSALISDPSSHMAFASTQSGPTAVRMVNHHLQGTSIPEAVAVNGNTGTAALDASGKFMYLLDSRKGIISAFAVENGNPVELSPKSYPAGHASTSLAIVKP